MKRLMILSCLVTIAGLLLGSCKDDGVPAATQQAAGPQLAATPSSVTVGIGSSQDVAINNGTPPYGIASGPASIATAVLSNPDSLVATVRVTGVTTASAGTSVTVKDNSVPQARTVTISIFVH